MSDRSAAVAERARGRMFRSLRIRNYRLYFVGQICSFAGTWMQAVAQSWLVLQLTGSATALGIATALQFLPSLVLGPIGGVVAERHDKRHLLIATQALACVQALLLGVLTISGVVDVWMVYVMAALLGTVNAIDNPARQTFVMEMVGPADVSNAVSLNVVIVNVARVVGPALAGVSIATLGTGPCFLINAASFLAVIAALLLIRPSELVPMARPPRLPRQLREGLAYVAAQRELLATLVLVALVCAFAWQNEVVLPLMAKDMFGGDASDYALLISSMGLGAIAGGLVAARLTTPSHRVILVSGVGFGIALAAAALAPTLAVAAAIVAFYGFASLLMLALCNVLVQLVTADHVRARVMALWSTAIFGGRAIGGPLVGWVCEQAGVRAGLTLGALTMAVALPLWVAMAGPSLPLEVRGSAATTDQGVSASPVASPAT